MDFTIFRDLRPGMKLIFTGFIVVVVFLIIQLVAAVLALPVFGFEKVVGMLTGLDFSDPESMKLLKYLQVLQTIGLFVVPSIIAASLFHPLWREYLQLYKKPTGQAILLVFLLIFIINPFINFTGEINSRMHFPEWLSGMETWMRNAEDTAEKLTKAFLKVGSFGGYLFNLFMIAVLPAIGEELLFRGVIQKLFTQMARNHHWGIWLSAALFSALHLQFYGFIPRMILGGIFGYLLVWSGSLWLPIIAHFINNAAAVTLLYLIDNGAISQRIEEFGTVPGEWYIALISFAIGLFLFITVRKQYPTISSKGEPPHRDY